MTTEIQNEERLMTEDERSVPKKKGVRRLWRRLILLLLLLLAAGATVFLYFRLRPTPEGTPVSLARGVQTLYCAGLDAAVPVYNEACKQTDFLPRGTKVSVDLDSKKEADGSTYYALSDRAHAWLKQSNLAESIDGVVPKSTIYVRTSQNLRMSPDNWELSALALKGAALTVIGYSGLAEDGSVQLYHVQSGRITGYLSGEYLLADKQEAKKFYEPTGICADHLGRGNRYGGGSASSLDYYPRQKLVSTTNVLPEHCYSLYLNSASDVIASVDDYIAYAKTTTINTFVVDIVDGKSVACSTEVMQKYCPSAAKNANNSLEAYKAAVQKIKDAGFYVVGRMTAFNDPYYAFDHPDHSICDKTGDPLEISGMYWPSAFSRRAWEYKVALAMEAVSLFGFNEIQFDYVRFPDGTYSFEKDGNINYQNVYGETKAEAIQRFLMYACDALHSIDVYVSADVFGETSHSYVASYGQYFPAISNVVDVISGMPYPDHYTGYGSYVPWLDPYKCLNDWAEEIVERQKETPSPAIVRTWIQAYDAIRSPYNTYGSAEIWAEISALRDNGLTAGFITWNAGSSLSKYRSLQDAFERLR